jgi:hypothetical protein
MRGRCRETEPAETPPHLAESGFYALLGTLSPHAGRGTPRSRRFPGADDVSAPLCFRRDDPIGKMIGWVEQQFKKPTRRKP